MPGGGNLTLSGRTEAMTSQSEQEESTTFCAIPPRNVPGPPESGSKLFSSKSNGDVFSTTSTGVTVPLYGKAIVESPSMPNTAPLPPFGKRCILNRLPSLHCPLAVIDQKEPDPACTTAGETLANAL